MHITLLLGTNREGRQSEKAARFLKSHIEKKQDIELAYIDVKDFDLPREKYGRDIKADFSSFIDTVASTDALIIVTPEYNHGYPGVLKSVLDLLGTTECKHKPVLLAGVSSGMWGGTRVIESLLPVVRTLGFVATSVDINFPHIEDAFQDGGNPKNDILNEVADKAFEELLWMAKTLKWGRENVV
jgi:NAD(P)H-dependent FMN reductase